MFDDEEDKEALGEGEEKENEDIYSDEGREELMEEEDEITDVDEGFMKGYEEGEKSAVCSNCGKLLEEDFIEQEIAEEMHRFCSNDCATEFSERKTLDEE